MRVQEIRRVAQQMGLKVNPRAKKAELIRQIQKSEGNYDCFGTATDYCDQYGCLWRQDCLGRG